jgi:hypothetical protein
MKKKKNKKKRNNIARDYVDGNIWFDDFSRSSRDSADDF